MPRFFGVSSPGTFYAESDRGLWGIMTLGNLPIPGWDRTILGCRGAWPTVCM